jgi:hypothetical protein
MSVKTSNIAWVVLCAETCLLSPNMTVITNLLSSCFTKYWEQVRYFSLRRKTASFYFQVQCDEDEYELDCHLYTLDYKIIDGDVSLPENSFKGTDFLPNGKFILFLMP